MPKNSRKTVLVTGATGHQGGAVLRHLRDRGVPVRALTRDPNRPEARHLVGHGTEVNRGDLNDPATLARAMDGVDAVYSVQGYSEDGVDGEVRQGTNLIDVAKTSRISLLVYSSVAAADQNTGLPHFESKNRIEQHLRGTGLQYTIQRPVFFMENWLGMRDKIEQGAIRLPLAPETRLQMIAVDDIGAFAAMAFTKPGHWRGRAVELAGDELSMTELADALGRASGREIRYEQQPWDEFEAAAGHEMALMYRWFQNVGYHVDISAVRQEHSGLMGFERWLRSKWVRTRTA